MVTAIITCQKHSFFLLLTAIEMSSVAQLIQIEQSEERGEVQNKELGSFVKIFNLFLKLCKFKKWHFYVKKKELTKDELLNTKERPAHIVKPMDL